MPLGPFALISLFYLVLGARVVYQLIRGFRQTFDLNFTRQDRMLVGQAAFFVLVPVSVALHELGHAMAIWLFGGQVLDWGFYGFAGYVAFDPREFNNAQQIIIASAGVAVNLFLAAIALALVFQRRPPFRAAINELLIQFTWISLINALVVYPLLDYITGLNGDWMQMYDFSAPALSATILVIHVVVLGGLFWAWKSPRARDRIAELTGDAAGPARGVGSKRSSRLTSDDATPTERTLRDVAARVASGWPTPVDASIQQSASGTALILSWGLQPLQRSVIAVVADRGGVELSGALRAEGLPPEQRAIGRDPAMLDADRLTMMLRLAMETVEGWTPTGGASPAATSVRNSPAAD